VSSLCPKKPLFYDFLEELYWDHEIYWLRSYDYWCGCPLSWRWSQFIISVYLWEYLSNEVAGNNHTPDASVLVFRYPSRHPDECTSLLHSDVYAYQGFKFSHLSAHTTLHPAVDFFSQHGLMQILLCHCYSVTVWLEHIPHMDAKLCSLGVNFWSIRHPMRQLRWCLILRTFFSLVPSTF